jgi:hypothetical protein
MVKNLVKKLIGEPNLGLLDYYFKPKLKKGIRGIGGPFNGQVYRKRIFNELLGAISFDAIVETGSYLGTTTEFFAATGLPVYTVEISPRYHSYATRRLRKTGKQVRLHQDNSPNFLRQLALNPSLIITKPFFYLDAHWYDHLPLKEELEIIYGRWKTAVVMVDDFQVPGTDYGYDDYGPGKALILDYLKSLRHLHLATFFPAAGPEQETGGKRGCIVLARDENIVKALQGTSVLTPGPR